MDIQKEREAFELSFKSTQIYCRECAIRGKDILEFSKTVNGYFNIVTNDAWNMWLDAKAQAVPEVLKKFCNEHKDPAWRGRVTEYDKGYSDCCIAVLEMIEAQEQSHD